MGLLCNMIRLHTKLSKPVVQFGVMNPDVYTYLQLPSENVMHDELIFPRNRF